MLVDLGTKLHLFDDRHGLVPAGLAGLLGGFVLELAVVHELGHRRPTVGGYLDQVKVGLLGQAQGIFDLDDADLFPFGADEAYLRYADALVDARLDADVSS
ncbi:hypothetical protein GCM10027298_16540 [Epidermidibacterium keratini]